MERLGEALKEAESFEPAGPEQRAWARELANEWRAKMGLSLLEEDDDIPELEFYRKARERGMLPRHHRPA
jgi:hypothetical protein